MNCAHATGLILMLGAALQFVLFLFGVSRRSYAALALPIAMAMTALSVLTFWLGLTMLQMNEQDEAVMEAMEAG